VLHGSASCDYLWIDEVSQVDVGLLNQIAKLHWAGVKFLLSGDFHQFAPICNNWRGSPVPEDALERSALLHTLAGGNRCTLSECRRGDRKLFDFYSSLIPGGSRAELPVHTCVAQAKAAFRSSAPARWNLVISHRRRCAINAERNRAEAPPGAVLLEVSGRRAQGNGAQSMLLWPGIQLFGCATTASIRNGVLYVVEAVDAQAKMLTIEGVGTMSFEQAAVHLRLSYAQTYASCQGTEFSGSLCLWDCAHKHFTRRHLFVALSRAKQNAAVSLRD
jgi:hypothetical protein